jgi:putative polyketide hydroxylase
VLRQAAEARGGDLRFHHELVQFTQDAVGVTATIRHRGTGAEHTLTADYLLAADGAGSPVRQALGVPTSGWGCLGHFINVYFEADLRAWVRGREFSMLLVREPGLTAFLVSINNADRWSLHLRYDPALGQHPHDYPEPVLLALLHRVLGLPELPIRIRQVLPWEMTVRTMTPYAGKGAAAGVQDAHNLAWKLAAVLRGHASPALLTTYQAERHPIGAFYANLSGEMADAEGLIDPAQLQRFGPQLLGLPDYTYRSAAVRAPDQGPTRPANALPLTGQPGTRLPHLWLDEARTMSTLDWCRGQFLLICSAAATGWQAVSHTALLPYPLVVRTLPPDTHSAWQQLTHTQPGDALLVRPDGFVAAWLPTAHQGAELATSLQQAFALG